MGTCGAVKSRWWRAAEARLLASGRPDLVWPAWAWPAWWASLRARASGQARTGRRRPGRGADQYRYCWVRRYEPAQSPGCLLPGLGRYSGRETSLSRSGCHSGQPGGGYFARARAAGARAGMRRREAQARCPGLEVLLRDLPAEARWWEPVVAAVETFAPGAEVLQPGQLALGARGASRYVGGDQALAAKVPRGRGGSG